MNAIVYRRRGDWATGTGANVGGSGRRGGATVPVVVAALLLPLAVVATATMCTALFGYVVFAVTWKVSAKVVSRVTDRRGEALDDAADELDHTRVIQSRTDSQPIPVSFAGLATAA
jgi:hypothetical protein